MTNVNIYVGEDGYLHFVDSAGADTVLPFNNVTSMPNVHTEYVSGTIRHLFERSALDTFDLKITASGTYQIFATTQWYVHGMNGGYEQKSAGTVTYTKDTLYGSDDYPYVVISFYDTNSFEMQFV